MFVQLQVQVNDGFCISPSQGTLTIKVRRNMYVPRWPASGPNITVTVLETWDIQQSIVTLTATDDDTGVGARIIFVALSVMHDPMDSLYNSYLCTLIHVRFILCSTYVS